MKRALATQVGKAGGVVIWLTPQQSELIRRLLATGLYGATRPDVIRTLMLRGFQEAISARILELP